MLIVSWRADVSTLHIIFVITWSETTEARDLPGLWRRAQDLRWKYAGKAAAHYHAPSPSCWLQVITTNATLFDAPSPS